MLTVSQECRISMTMDIRLADYCSGQLHLGVSIIFYCNSSITVIFSVATGRCEFISPVPMLRYYFKIFTRISEKKIQLFMTGQSE